MTYQDIYNKFMIEYDKANVTSSYPSLTLYEAVTILDKAYLALIAQKLTGNNPRRTPFEADTKATEDLRPLVVTEGVTNTSTNGSADFIENSFSFNLPSLMLYYISAYALIKAGGVVKKRLPVIEIDHAVAYRFLLSSVNIPWIKNPVCYFENNIATMLYDKWELDNLEHSGSYSIVPMITYLKKPKSFLSAFGFSEEQGGGEDNPDVPQQLWMFLWTYSNEDKHDGLTYLYDSSNLFTITVNCFKGSQHSTVTIGIESEYATLSGNVLTVKNTTGDLFLRVDIYYTCDEDNSAVKHDYVYVKYYQELQQGGEPGPGDNQDPNVDPLEDLTYIELNNVVWQDVDSLSFVFVANFSLVNPDSEKEYRLRLTFKLEDGYELQIGEIPILITAYRVLYLTGYQYIYGKLDLLVITRDSGNEIISKDQISSTGWFELRPSVSGSRLSAPQQYLTPELNEFVLDEDYIDYI